MLVAPRPGVDRKNLVQSLRSVYTDALNLRGGGPQEAYKRLLSYLDWASSAVRMLGDQISGADLDRLVLTRRYELLLSGVGNMTATDMEVQRVVNGLVSTELDQRVAAFEAALRALEEQVSRWSGLEHFVMPDSSFYIHHREKLEEADFAEALNLVGPHHPVHVLVPIVVVDELDRLKESKDRTVRWRAGYTVAVLDRVFSNSTGRVRLCEAAVPSRVLGAAPRGEVTIEMLFDPPGHIRLPIDDDEIIDRALAVEPLAARKATLLTYDTGQSTRARAVGLKVIKLRRTSEEDIG